MVIMKLEMSLRTPSDLKTAHRGVQAVSKYYLNFPEVPQITCWEHITDRGLKIEHERGESGPKKLGFPTEQCPNAMASHVAVDLAWLVIQIRGY